MEVLCPLIKKPSLSLHHSVLRCYRKYGTRIQDLRLFDVHFDGLSDFVGLVAAFTGIRSLTCSEISFRMAKEVDSSLLGQGAGILSRVPQILALTEFIEFLSVCTLWDAKKRFYRLAHLWAFPLSSTSWLVAEKH